ncbi:uncharacterized protein MELLADRAFT_73279 [Melampsora larici-populina 98AG31]|uniref:Uncharacterized protein n=1 Tax=Melampsora larici-populina (strain 98AG31 / pathotype 3-4-7) TaxID=747676 RepID=F4S5S2_MELLP|nr:uncharacterized protein MELLADRAFT_73279 [Melampsora larici-populina 98AG31]EGF99947.1 hypothetical protein MELLADRAFT_73279 [Melampsora larici-populina 98AG31]
MSSITIYGNLTLAGNSSIATIRSSRRRGAAAQNLTRPRSNTRQHSQPAVDDLAMENLEIRDVPIDDAVINDIPIENQAINHQQAMEQPHPVEVVEAPRLQQDPLVPAARPARRNRNALLRPRRSSRIARRTNLRRLMYRRRRPLPSAQDRSFWTKIWTLPANLLIYLSPEWEPIWCTRDVLRQIVWHFKPNLHIPCRTLKAKLVDQFQTHVVYQYGAYYGI